MNSFHIGPSLAAVLTTALLVACGGGADDGIDSSAGAYSGSSAKDGGGRHRDGGSTDAGSSDAAIDGSDINDAAPDSMYCVPGSYVFCRCWSTDEGTKRCSDDGTEFAACDCR